MASSLFVQQKGPQSPALSGWVSFKYPIRLLQSHLHLSVSAGVNTQTWTDNGAPLRTPCTKEKQKPHFLVLSVSQFPGQLPGWIMTAGSDRVPAQCSKK